ncbi:recombinase family protein [Colwellia sp. PAMC 21821]|uniref:recombinase family protein n=1 Tax=Colwellia sp. PAMC 21821 TaxID=1816219 RepID=UPI0009BD747A|nr:recombinase family protein [Colwellia sp. PAMC 21821]ARD43800.1 resolvase [Colwellia sp. PAMC 21821]
MNTRIYLRASTKEQDADRATQLLIQFCGTNNLNIVAKYVENISGTKLNRPQLNKLLDESQQGEILLVESVDRLSRLPMSDWEKLKSIISDKGLKLVVVDLPTTHTLLSSDDITASILSIINNMLLDLMATMARLDNDKRIERIKQGQQRAIDAGKKIGGSTKNQEIRSKVISYLSKKLTAEEVAKMTDCGVATVYRIKKELKLLT